MKMSRLVFVTAVLAACDSPTPTELVHPAGGLNASRSGKAQMGQLFSLSNSPTGNAVLAFDRADDGSLSAAGSYPTGGTGTGGGLGNQGALALDRSGRILVAVNAGSDEISSFLVQEDGSLKLASTVPSGGTRPVSVAIHGRLVYALNAGGSGNITGFQVSRDGELNVLDGSTRPLSSDAAGPAQVEFDQRGRVLIVTEKATNRISTYGIASDGLASGPTVIASQGATPFGFAVTSSNVLIVSEAFGGAADASAASSYRIGADGSLSVISGSVATTETAACWFVVTRNDRFAYTSNTGSGSITGYLVKQGALSLLDADGRTGVTGQGTSPIDLVLSPDSRFLYSLNAGNETISRFAVNTDGSLSSRGADIANLPDGATGLATR